MCEKRPRPLAFNLSLSHPLCLPARAPQEHSGCRTAEGTPKRIAVIFSLRDLRRYASRMTQADAPRKLNPVPTPPPHRRHHHHHPRGNGWGTRRAGAATCNLLCMRKGGTPEKRNEAR